MAYLGQPSVFNTNTFGDVSMAQNFALTQLVFSYGLNLDLISVFIVSSGTVISSPPFAIVATGASPSASGSFQSKARCHNRPGEGFGSIFSAIFTSGLSGSNQYVGLGDSLDGFFFGFNGATFGILYQQVSYSGTVSNIVQSTTWIPQSSWNQDPCNGMGMSGFTLDPTLGNIYKIRMQGLGFGKIDFLIVNPVSGNFILAHQILYSNFNTETACSNFSLPVLAFAGNSTNNSNVMIQIPAMATFIEGVNYESDIVYSHAYQATSLTNLGLSNLFNIQNVSTFNGIVNGKVVLLKTVSFQSTGTGSLTYSLVLNPVLTGTNYVNVLSGNSCVQYDNTGTYSSGGKTLISFFIGINGQQNINLTSYKILLNAGDILMVGVTVLTGSFVGQGASANISWVERY